MKKRIRLGISSMSNCVRTISQPQLSSQSIITPVSIPKSTFTNLSPHDLDDMFETNLQLLQNLEQSEQSVNKTSNIKNFKSSLSVYIAPTVTQNPNFFCALSDITSNNTSRTQMKQSKPKRLNCASIYSSYEALYDELILTKEENIKDREWECMSQSMIETSRIGSTRSFDSDETLKSISFESINDIHFDERNETHSNQSLPIKQTMVNEIHLDTKLRSHPTKIITRPISYHLGDFSNFNCSNKPPSYPFNYSNKVKEIQNEIHYSPANVAISKFFQSPLKNNFVDRDISLQDIKNENVKKEQFRCFTPVQTFLSSSNNNNNNNSNIINNQILYLPQYSKNQSNKNVCITPPVPPRNRIITNVAHITKNISTSRSSTESIYENKKISHINSNNKVNQNKVKINGSKHDRRVQNYDNEFSFLDRQMNNFLCLKSVHMYRPSKKL